MKITILAISFLIISLCNSIIHAAEINYSRDKLSVTIAINGGIVKGDYDKFLDVLVRSFIETTEAFNDNMIVLKLDDPDLLKEITSDTGPIPGAISLKVVAISNGGDLSEAMKIGRAIREMFIKTDASVSDNEKTTCASACFFIWVSGIERDVEFHSGHRYLGVHRLYFNPAEYKNLSATEAEKKYSKAKDAAEKYLQDMGVPENLIHKSFTVSSKDVYFLTEDEINLLTGTAPFYDELIISRCGSHDEKEKEDHLTCNVIYPNLKEYPDISNSKSRSIYIERKCKKMSKGYLHYIDEKYLKIRKCRNKHDDIERWKMMARYLGIDNVKLGGSLGDKTDIVSKVHPGWIDLVNSKKYDEWIIKQPKSTKELASSDYVSDAIKLIDLYKKDQK